MAWIDAGIFPATIMFSCGFKYGEINKLLTKKRAHDWKTGISEDKGLIESGENFALDRTIYDTKNSKNKKRVFYIIFTEQFKFTDYEFCKLAHEVLHICQFALPDFLNRDREFECEAYLHTHIMQQCLKVLRNKK